MAEGPIARLPAELSQPISDIEIVLRSCGDGEAVIEIKVWTDREFSQEEVETVSKAVRDDSKGAVRDLSQVLAELMGGGALFVQVNVGYYCEHAT